MNELGVRMEAVVAIKKILINFSWRSSEEQIIKNLNKSFFTTFLSVW